MPLPYGHTLRLHDFSVIYIAATARLSLIRALNFARSCGARDQRVLATVGVLAGAECLKKRMKDSG